MKSKTRQTAIRTAATNTVLAKVAVQCSADTFTNKILCSYGIGEPFGGVVNQSLVLRINPPEADAENRHLPSPKPFPNQFNQIAHH